VAYGKVEPLITAAEQRAILQSNAELHRFIELIDAELELVQAQIDEKIEQIQARLRKLEGG